ncbi:MAG: hypothetical protein EXS12_00040 [Phycisphaerales bacterium]|nr:hypothetical protein [Phycisphaerales bacterium]
MDPGANQLNGNKLSRQDLLIALVLTALTLVLRLMYLLYSPDFAWPHSVLYEGEAPVWAQWAAKLKLGQPFEYDLAFRTPGVAWMLHWLGFIATPYTSAKIIWCAISAVTTGLLYLVVARWFSRRAGMIAATLFALSYGSFVLATSLNNEAPYALLLVAIIGATLRWIDGPTFAWSLLLGALHGCALLLRAEHALLLGMLLIYAASRARKNGAAPTPTTYESHNHATTALHTAQFTRVALHSAVVLAAVVALCAPWINRSHNAARTFNTDAPPIFFATAQPPWTPAAIAYLNRLPAFARAGNFAFMCDLNKRGGLMVVDDTDVRAFFEQQWNYTPEPIAEWSLISLKGPLDFALANHAQADGGFSNAGLGDSHGSNAIFSLARPSHTRLVNHGYEIGLDYIRANPARWFTLVNEKLARFQDGATLGLFANDWPHNAKHVRRAIDVATPIRDDAPMWNFAVLTSLVIGAFFACLRRGGVILLLVLAYKIAITIAFFGYARQAVSIAPVLFALSALCVDAACMLAPRSRWFRWPARAALAALFIVAAVQATHPPRFNTRPAKIQGQIIDTPQWGSGAFESFDQLLLEPQQN